jgi:amidase
MPPNDHQQRPSTCFENQKNAPINPNFSSLLDNFVLNHDFKFDFNAYLASRPGAPIRSLEEVISSGKYIKAVETVIKNAQAVDSRDTKEYFQHLAMRNTLQQAVLKVMVENNLDAIAYPTLTRKASLIGEAQPGSNCRLSSNSGLPAIVVPGGFTSDGLPVGVELLGRAWGEPQLIKIAYAYEQATHHRRPPASTPAIGR